MKERDIVRWLQVITVNTFTTTENLKLLVGDIKRHGT